MGKQRLDKELGQFSVEDESLKYLAQVVAYIGVSDEAL